jgi:hypothetical protein
MFVSEALAGTAPVLMYIHGGVDDGTSIVSFAHDMYSIIKPVFVVSVNLACLLWWHPHLLDFCLAYAGLNNMLFVWR